MAINPYESPQALESSTEEFQPRPMWVRVGLWLVPTRRAAMGWMWFSVVVAVVCFLIPPPLSWAWIGVVFIFAALWYKLSMRWMDHHDRW